MAIRLFVEERLEENRVLELGPGQTHYLSHVMRLAPGDRLRLFNGLDGEWEGRIEALAKKRTTVLLERRRCAQTKVPDLWLLFAPIKGGRIDTLVEKATELGVALLKPVMTERTVVRRVNLERLRAQAIEAAEQTGRLCVPELCAAEPLFKALAGWPETRRLLLCDETGSGPPILEALREAKPTPSWALLTGPEGGFAKDELDALRGLPFVTSASLGPRVLRADTAAIAALTCWQAALGDWQSRPAFRAADATQGNLKMPRP
ncbi:MAG: 16S rRNA (uracil(1498)-N(3))-methyltransferase [Pseudomonadota bacterium]